MTRCEEFIVQAIARWHPGCGGGSAWIKWGLQAITGYRSTNPGPEADGVAELADRLWADPANSKCRMLASPSPAGRALFRCAIHYISDRRNWPLAESESRRSDFESLPREATGWARSVVNLVEALFELPAEILDMVRRAAADRNLRLPIRVDLDKADDLVDAVESKLALENAINAGNWAVVSGGGLDTEEAKWTLEKLLQLARFPNCRSGRDIAFGAIAYDFNRRACDGRELELSILNIVHVPDRDSPFRERTRKQMLDIIQKYLAGPDRDAWAERIAGQDVEKWAEMVVQRWKSEPESVRDARRFPSTAAHILIGMGDAEALAAITRWLSEYPQRAANLFEPHLFDTYCYEIVPPGRRRDLVLDCRVNFERAAQPPSAARRDSIELFRPMPGHCKQCRAPLMALFDVLVDPAEHRGLPAVQRLCLPMCPTCSEGSSGFSSRLLIDDPDDMDAWPLSNVASNSLPARCFRVRASEGSASRAEAWLGGCPRWEQQPSWPHCESCRRRMIFAGQIDAHAGHPFYGFFCPECLTSNVRTQYD